LGGVKLAVLTLGHQDVEIIPYEFAHSKMWELTFYIVLIAIAVSGWVLSKERPEKQPAA